MKNRLFSLVMCGVLALLVPTFAVGQALPVKTVEFNSDSVGRKMKYHIILPAKYEQSSERYPVLYLLHGLTGNYTNWSHMGVPEYARSFDLIVVMSDAGNSWYVNWSKSDDGEKNNWEDAVVKDLVGHVDATFRTIAKRDGRAINGLSMGGYGGLTLGLRHPELFCSAGSHSGAVAYAKQRGERLKAGIVATKKDGKPPSTIIDPKIGIEGFSSQAQRFPKGQMFTTAEECAAYDPFELILKLPREQLPYIYVDCGTEDFLYKDNAALAKLLLENKIPHTFAQSSGGHDSAYWKREVAESMAVQYVIMRRQVAKTQATDKPKAKEAKAAVPIKTGLHLNNPKAFRGYTLFAPLNSTKVYLIDMEGKVAHTWEGAARPAGCGYLLENGHLLRPCLFEATKTPFGTGGGSGGRVQEFTWEGELVWDFQLANDKQLAHHDVHKLPNGNLLMLAGEMKSAEEVADAGCKTAANVRADYVIEVKPMGKTGGEIVWEWHMWDHLVQDADKSKANFGEVARHPELMDVNFGFGAGSKAAKGGPGKGDPGKGGIDWTHTNSLDYNAELDQIMLSVHNFSEVWIIDHGTTTSEASGHIGGKSGKGGDILLRWGNPVVHRAGAAVDQQLFVQHNALWIPKDAPGGGHALVFNNGSRRPGGNFSSVDEFVLPVNIHGGYASASAHGPGQAVWTYVAPKKTDFYSGYISGAQRLPNGNTLICSGADGIFFEVTAEKEVVWKYVNPVRPAAAAGKSGGAPTPGAVFRAYRYSADYPGFSGKNMKAAKTVEELLAEERPKR